MIRKATLNDAKELAAIYNYYVENTVVTFETEPVAAKEMLERILKVSCSYPFLVYEEAGSVAGYACASRWKKREAYRHTVESTIYVRRSEQSKGFGVSLMQALIDELRERSVHAVIACITHPNPQSAGFHRKLGFRPVSRFREVGYKFNQWIDVCDWELLL
jgi:phosphinothricin acetyltransferase